VYDCTMLDRGTGMFALLQKLIDAISALWTLLGWFGLTAAIISLSTAAGGVIWAMVTGIAGPIVLMAAFCTITAGVYLALVPMAYRTLRRIQDMPISLHFYVRGGLPYRDHWCRGRHRVLAPH
jgi:hypothetical protein